MRNKVLGFLGFGILLVCTANLFAQNDFKIKQRMTAGGRTSETALMIKGARERSESSVGGIQNVSIMECDLRRTLFISDAEKKYYIEPMASSAPTTTTPSAPVKTTSKVKSEKGGTVTRTMEIIDTGERQQMFGMTARHIKTIMTTEPSADACEKDKQRIETDGWYVDLNVGLSCKFDRPLANPMDYGRSGGGCQDQQKFVQKGTGKLGYALKVTTKISMGDDDDEDMDPQMAAMMGMSTEVVELSKAALPQSLFEIPAGYTEASSRQELYGRNTQKAQGDYARSGKVVEDIPAVPMSNPLGPKRPGEVRIGVLPVGNSSGKPLDTEKYRSMLISQISGDRVIAVALGSMGDGEKMDCDYILTTDIKSLKQSAAGKIGGMFGKVTGAPTSGGKVESVVAYTLKAVGGSPVLQLEATTKAEGEDNSVMTAIGNEAQAVMKAVKK
jgi:hypothetical protein